MLTLSLGFFDSGFGISKHACAELNDLRRKGFVIPMMMELGPCCPCPCPFAAPAVLDFKPDPSPDAEVKEGDDESVSWAKWPDITLADGDEEDDDDD